MNYFWHKIKKTLIPLIAISFLISCSGEKAGTCIMANPFMDSRGVILSGKGLNVSGGYNSDVPPHPEEGVPEYGKEPLPIDGQTSDWLDTGFRYNGKDILIKVSGKIYPFGIKGQNTNICKFCAQKPGDETCYCIGDTEIDTTECKENIYPPQFQSNKRDFYYNPNISFTSLARLKIDEDTDGSQRLVLREPTDNKACYYDRGMNAYIGFWGDIKGNENPKQAFHLFSREEICEVMKDGECKYKSYLISYKKDQINANRGEVIKLIFNDRFYHDNSGAYNVQFLSGIGGTVNPGLIEEIITKFEELTLGKKNSDGKREGSIIENLYNNIVQSNFSSFIRYSLILYIVIFGLSILAGVVEVNRKEIFDRIIKIALIVTFISPQSWNMYNQYIVNFFSNGIDSLLEIIDNSQRGLLMCDSNDDSGKASRFACLDFMVKSFFSESMTTKIFGLLFNSLFGLIYIIIIFGIIAFFIYLTLFAATIYIVNLLKVIFALSLGPIFICLTLYKATSSLFNNWITFLVSRSLEIMVLFAVLFFFLPVIQQLFNSMLFYSVCYHDFYFIKPILSSTIPIAELERSLGEWILEFIKLGALIYFTLLILQQSSSFASNLAAYGGAKMGSSREMASQLSGQGTFEIANKLMKTIRNRAFQGSKLALKYSSGFLGFVGRAAFSETIKKMGNAMDAIDYATGKIGRFMPFRGLGTRVIDDAIKKAQSKANQRNLTGEEAQAFIRKQVRDELTEKRIGFDRKNPAKEMNAQNIKFNALRINEQAINRRLDKFLIEKPIKDKISEICKNRKMDQNFIPTAQERSAIKEEVKQWAENSRIDQKKVEKYMEKSRIKSYIRTKSALSSSEAVKKFAGNEELKKQYLEHLEQERLDRKIKLHDKRIDRHDKIHNHPLHSQLDKTTTDSSRLYYHGKDIAKSVYKELKNRVSRAYHNIRRDTAHNPKIARANFERAVLRREKGFFKKDTIKNTATYQAIAKNLRKKDKSTITTKVSRELQTIKETQAKQLEAKKLSVIYARYIKEQKKEVAKNRDLLLTDANREEERNKIIETISEDSAFQIKDQKITLTPPEASDNKTPFISKLLLVDEKIKDPKKRRFAETFMEHFKEDNDMMKSIREDNKEEIEKKLTNQDQDMDNILDNILNRLNEKYGSENIDPEASRRRAFELLIPDNDAQKTEEKEPAKILPDGEGDDAFSQIVEDNISRPDSDIIPDYNSQQAILEGGSSQPKSTSSKTANTASVASSFAASPAKKDDGKKSKEKDQIKKYELERLNQALEHEQSKEKKYQDENAIKEIKRAIDRLKKS